MKTDRMSLLAFPARILAIVDSLALLKQAANTMKDDAGREIGIFTEAVKVSPQKRAAFLDDACGGDENLRRKVEALLSAHDRLGNFLEEPPLNEPY
jgi:hypothetical protein